MHVNQIVARLEQDRQHHASCVKENKRPAFNWHRSASEGSTLGPERLELTGGQFSPVGPSGEFLEHVLFLGIIDGGHMAGTLSALSGLSAVLVLKSMTGWRSVSHGYQKYTSS